MFSSEYGRRRDVWNQRLHEMGQRQGSIERRQSGSVHKLSSAESRRKREQDRKETRSAERVKSLGKLRKKTSAERELEYLNRPHPSLTRSRSPSTARSQESYDDFTQGGTGGAEDRVVEYINL